MALVGVLPEFSRIPIRCQNVSDCVTKGQKNHPRFVNSYRRENYAEAQQQRKQGLSKTQCGANEKEAGTAIQPVEDSIACAIRRNRGNWNNTRERQKKREKTVK
ncbi:hypothetical protein OUZ56_003772 [Daphnia magna]|uniref:Uncharacterized protein n=1 Tax=Daphnia magna TaxID=35525 RepID=A0ABQ9YMP8_9CRUS|nr:hypothetical protein OUZ56_003772 [Daphnia magna]